MHANTRMFGKNGAGFGCDFAQPVARPRPSSESSPGDPQTRQPFVQGQVVERRE